MILSDRRFGREMKRLRLAKGISQRKLGEIVGLGSGYISRIERGLFKPPSEEKIVAIADTLGGNRDYMLSLSGKISSDVMNAVKKHPEKMSEAVRGFDKMGDLLGVTVIIMLLIAVLKGEHDKEDISKNEWKELMLELRKEAEKLPSEKQLGVINHIRDLMDSWENDIIG
ncbi:MAG: helix-turn-helix domain-containing protein [Candidatus Aegiribacteria sp.]|nr:helix-turn-helix domain-containing protein [Candidatus Aegiribacteria sp.]